MAMAVLVFLSIVSMTLTFCCALHTVNVTTSLGTVVGLHVTNSNIEYYSFRGIPYANVTERFKGPSPMKPWQTTVEAFSDGPRCPQPEFIIKMPDSYLPQNEECLYMNIFTPKLPKEGDHDRPKLPVMVFIHGSGFIMLSGSSVMHGPEYIMEEKDVVLVTFNYRLGFFGYLSTGTEDAQGNAGMKDQVEALKWVQREIVHFGGDPSRVTLFGISAGGASVVLHTISPMSKGLFHAAIAQSGSGMADWAHIDVSIARRRATRLAELLCCNTENTTTIVNCLRKMSVSAINQATNDIVAEEGSILIAAPVTETSAFYEDTFLPDTPSNLFDNLEVSSSVPLIIGTDKDEGMMLLFGDFTFEQVEKNLHSFIPFSLSKHLTPEQLTACTQKLRQFYFDGESVTQARTKGLVDLATDHMFMYPAVQVARKLVAKRNDVYLYHYVYSRVIPITFWDENVLKPDYEGVEHAAEMTLIFYSSILGGNLSDTESSDYKMRKRLIKLWTTFAKTRSPVSNTDLMIKDIKWPKVADTTELTYLEMNSTFSVGKNYYEERVAFWDQLLSKSQKDEL